MTCLGVLDRGERGDDYGTSLKEGGGTEMSTTVLHSRAALSLDLLTGFEIVFMLTCTVVNVTLGRCFFIKDVNLGMKEGFFKDKADGSNNPVLLP